MSDQRQRPPPIAGSNTQWLTNSARPSSHVVLAVNKLMPAPNAATAKIKQIGGSIPKLSEHADKLEIKLKQYNSPVLGIHGTIRNRAASSRGKPVAVNSTDLLAKFDDAVYNPEMELTRKISQELQQINSINTKARPPVSLTHSFLLGDKETIEEEMAKLHDMVTSQTEATLGYGFNMGESKAIKSSHTPKNKNANQDSQRSFRAMSTKIDNKVTQWMKNNLGSPQKAENARRDLKQLMPALPEGDTKTNRVINKKLKEISDQFHKSLSEATGAARDLIKTPDDNYVQELAKKTQDSLAMMALTEGDIDSAFHKAIVREERSSNTRYENLYNQLHPTLPKTTFKPLHSDLKTKKKLHNYVARRNEPFSPRPPRKDFENDYVNPMQLFKGADFSDPMELRRRRSLIEASEPQIFQRTIDNGQLNNHRKIVDPDRFDSPIQQKSRWTPPPIIIPKHARQGSPRNSLGSKDAGKQKLKPMKATAGSQSAMGEGPKKYYPNSKHDSKVEINRKLERSVKNIEDATKVATALGSLMSKVALADNVKGQRPNSMDLTGILQPPAVGANALRTLHSASNKNTNIVTLAKELRKMADDTKAAHQADLNKIQGYTSIEEKEGQDRILKYSRQNNLSLLPGVSYTDQMLLNKLKSMEEISKQ